MENELELQKRADMIAGVMYKFSDSDDEVTWLMSDKFHEVALKILLLIQQPKEDSQPQLKQADVSGSLPQVNWAILRQKYFSDCTVKDSVDGLKLRIDYAPHDLFEWFKREIQHGGNDR